MISNFAFKNQSKIYKYIQNIKNLLQYQTQSTLVRLVLLMMSTKPYYLTNLSSQVFPLVISCRQTTMPVQIQCTSVRLHLIFIDLSEEEILEILNSLDPDKSSDIDTIGPRVLKKGAYSLCGPLHYLFVTSLSKHIIQLDWCTHVITPAYKSEDKSLVNNYHPISLLYNTSKILEQLIYNKVIPHISGFLIPHQFGFLKNISTIQQLLVLFDVIMSSEHQTDVIYVDFKKAFDTVPHNELNSVEIYGHLWKSVAMV